MSLSTQLVRGTLALPVLTLFALLGVVAGQVSQADPLPPEPVAMVARLCSIPARPMLVLSQAPGDLGPIALRPGHSCRA